MQNEKKTSTWSDWALAQFGTWACMRGVCESMEKGDDPLGCHGLRHDVPQPVCKVTFHTAQQHGRVSKPCEGLCSTLLSSFFLLYFKWF